MSGLRQPPSIEAFGGGGFRTSAGRVEGSMLILDDVVHPWPATAVSELSPDDFETVIATGPAAVEFVLLGTGKATAPAPKPVREALRASGLGLEVMNTPEACRLYNVLSRDGRRLAAALIAV